MLTDDFQCRKAEAHVPSTRHTEAQCTREYAQPLVSVEVLKGKYASSNGGVSDRYDTLDLYPAGTWESQVHPDHRDKAVVLEEGNLSGTVIVVPVSAPSGVTHCGPMASGAYVASSDSRFREAVEKLLGHRFYGALPLHDRYETWGQYDALSR